MYESPEAAAAADRSLNPVEVVAVVPWARECSAGYTTRRPDHNPDSPVGQGRRVGTAVDGVFTRDPDAARENDFPDGVRPGFVLWE